MSSGTGLAMSADGRLVVIKTAGPGPGAARLRHEAEALRRAASPGVVELMGERSGNGGTTLTTAFVGGGTLAEHMGGRCDLGVATRVVAAVAATMADLHDRGITHGRLAADHILVGSSLVDTGGQAVVCGWAEATLDAGPGPGASAVNADVAALGALLRELAEGRTTAGAEALRRVAERALASDPAARPSMRSLAAVLRALVPEGPGPGPSVPAAAASPTGARVLAARRPARHRARRRPPAPILVAAAALASVAVAGVALSGGGGAEQPERPGALAGATAEEPPEAPGHAAAPTPSTVATTVAAGRVWPPPPPGTPPCPPVAAPVAADVDGDGCDEGVEVAAGVVRAAGAQWQVATATDVVLVGDWDCDGVATAAVVRPGSGQVWLFAHWAGTGEDVAAVLAKVVPGAVSATVVERPPGAPATACDRIEVLDHSGAATVV